MQYPRMFVEKMTGENRQDVLDVLNVLHRQDRMGEAIKLASKLEVPSWLPRVMQPVEYLLNGNGYTYENVRFVMAPVGYTGECHESGSIQDLIKVCAETEKRVPKDGRLWVYDAFTYGFSNQVRLVGSNWWVSFEVGAFVFHKQPKLPVKKNRLKPDTVFGTLIMERIEKHEKSLEAKNLAVESLKKVLDKQKSVE